MGKKLSISFPLLCDNYTGCKEEASMWKTKLIVGGNLWTNECGKSKYFISIACQWMPDQGEASEVGECGKRSSFFGPMYLAHTL